MSTFRSKTGPIPDAAFENEPGYPKDPKTFMSPADLARFDRETEELRQQVEKLRKSLKKRTG